MEAYELAQRLRVVREREKHIPIFRDLAELLNKAGPLWSELSEKKFDENEHGYICLKTTNNVFSDNLSDDWLDEIKVIFMNIDGEVQELGSINRVPGDDETNEFDTGYAEVEIGGNGLPITPEEDEWDVIVGTIERAVKDSQ